MRFEIIGKAKATLADIDIQSLKKGQIPAVLAAQPAPAEDFCYCDDDISLQMVSGGAALEGLYGRVTLKINGQYVDYVKAQPAPAEHVAWCKYEQRHERPTRIVLCDSDEDGAFRVYAAPPAAQPAPAEPVALESVHLTRDIKGMCTVRVNGRVAIQDNGDIIDHMATLEWFAAPPAAPAPTVPNGCEKIFTHKWLDPDCIERGCKSLAAPPAAPAVPLTDEQIRSMWLSSEFRGNGGQVDWFCEGIRAAEAHHGITGGKP